MASSPPSRLTPLQRELLEQFFHREHRFFLTGGGALAGFYFGHRTTEDLDFFAPPGLDLAEAARALEEAAQATGATVRPAQIYPDFRRLFVERGDETCVVDLVIDRAPMVDSEKQSFGAIRVDTLREIAANKICTLLSRSEPKDLVDLAFLIRSGIDLRRAFEDAQKKDRGAEPATLAWILDQVTISPRARLPGGIDPVDLDAFRVDLVRRLRAMAFEKVPK
ncbi:MAG: nucleotidyl transferase AbiEii/AbiGii toxin family protein [Myxococcota bacterium]